jgi:hypothetical protein
MLYLYIEKAECKISLKNSPQRLASSPQRVAGANHSQGWGAKLIGSSTNFYDEKKTQKLVLDSQLPMKGKPILCAE